MGQKHGKATFAAEALLFLNCKCSARLLAAIGNSFKSTRPQVPFAGVEALWEGFNDVADGFAITLEDTQEIFRDLREYLSMEESSMKRSVKGLFLLFDSDGNGLIDAIELLCSLALTSGMQTRDVVEFILSCYDFDGSRELTIDELTLAFRSTLFGLSKMTGARIPRDEELEGAAMDAFVRSAKNVHGAMAISEILDYVVTNPDIWSWLRFFDCPSETGVERYVPLDQERDHQLETPQKSRDSRETASLEDTPLLVPAPKEKGDEEPWRVTKETLVPSDASGFVPPTRAPLSALSLDWVHGYRGADCRNNVYYSRDGSVVYHAARVAVVYSPSQRTQLHMMDHTDDILSIASHPNGNIFATGESGKRPKIIIWGANDVRCIRVIKGLHQRGVRHLCFNPNGDRLASIGDDSAHHLAVYDWAANTLLFSSATSPEKVLALLYGDAERLVTAGEAHITFWERQLDAVVAKPGIVGRLAKKEDIVSLANCNDRVVSGSVGGKLCMWHGRNCVKIVSAHSGSVNALHSTDFGVISGGKDQRIRIWTLRLEAGATFDMSAYGLSPSIRAVRLNSEGTKLLLGTRGCEIFEVSAADGSDVHGGTITSGNFSGELRGLSVSPVKPEYVTVGDDAVLRLWDVETRTLVQTLRLPAPSRAVGYSPDGDMLVVGFGSGEPGENPALTGAFRIVSEADLSTVYEARDAQGAILEAKYSPDGETFALASADATIYIYSTDEDFQLIGRCKKHARPVVHMDFSDDSKWLQSNCLGQQHLFYNAENGQYQSNSNAMKDVPWATHTCAYSWHTGGMHDDASDMTSVDKSPTSPVYICATSSGTLRVFAAPCPIGGRLYHGYRGHSSGVLKARFTPEDDYVVSIGAEDGCVFQWTHLHDRQRDVADALDDDNLSDGIRDEMLEGESLDLPVPHEWAVDINGDVATQLEQPKLPRRPAVLDAPWTKQSVPPTDFAAPTEALAPTGTLTVCRTIGFAAKELRNAVRYDASGLNIVFPCGRVAVSQTLRSGEQRLHDLHPRRICALACSKDGALVATADVGKVPLITVWEAGTTECRSMISGSQGRAISAMAFSPDGRILASVGCDAHHRLVLYDWPSSSVLSSATTTMQKVLGVAWSPASRRLVTVGNHHIGFWTREARNLIYAPSTLGLKGKTQLFPVAIFFGSVGVVGTGDGHLYVFPPDSAALEKTVKAHASCVYALYETKDELISGGRDGFVKVWNADVEALRQIDVRNWVKGVSLSVKSVCVSPDGTKLLFSISGGEIHEVPFGENASAAERNAVVTAHFRGAATGLAVAPNAKEFVTTGTDKSVRVWALDTGVEQRRTVLDTVAYCAAYAPNGSEIALGLGNPKATIAGKNDGAIVIVAAQNLTKVIFEGRDSTEAVLCLCYSADGRSLAAGGSDAAIYVYAARDGYQRKAVIRTHDAPVAFLDFSLDGQYLRSGDMPLDGTTGFLHFSDVVAGLDIPDAAGLRDHAWQSHNVPYGWYATGAWEDLPSGISFTACARPPKIESAENDLQQNVFVVGDNVGRIFLHRFPCAVSGQVAYCTLRHAAAVRKVAWSKNGTYAVSVGDDGVITVYRFQSDDGSTEDATEFKRLDDGAFRHDGGGETSKLMQEVLADKFHSVGDVEPWRRTLIKPGDMSPDDDTDAPAITTSLFHIFGGRMSDLRGVVHFNSNQKMVCTSGQTGVMFDSVTHEQRFHTSHSRNAGDVSCLAMTRDAQICATGTFGRAPEICVWDALTGLPLARFSAVHNIGVAFLAFSTNTRFLASVGHETNHRLRVFLSPSGQWSDARCILVDDAGAPRPTSLTFVGNLSWPLLLGHEEGATFLSAYGTSFLRRRGIFGRQRVAQPVLSTAIVPGKGEEDVVVCGGTSGHLFSWDLETFRVKKAVKAHNCAIGAVCALASSGCVSGSADGFVKVWNRSFGLLKEISLMDATPAPFYPNVCSVAGDQRASRFIVGCTGGEIYQVTRDSGCVMLLCEGHSTLEIHGLAMNPVRPDEFATTGDDAVLRIWSLEKRDIARRTRLESGSRAIAWRPDGKDIALGFGNVDGDKGKDGGVVILDAETLELKQDDRKARGVVTDMKYSPDGALLVVASADGRIYFYTVSNLTVVATTPKELHSPLRVDFSSTGKQIQVGTKGRELLYYNSDMTSEDKATPIRKAADIRKTTWHTQTLPFGWTVQGIWALEGVDLKQNGPFDVAVDRSPNSSLLVVGYSDGTVALTNYPSQAAGNKYIDLPGVASPVSRVLFSTDGQHVVALGRISRSVVVYKVSGGPASDGATIESGKDAEPEGVGEVVHIELCLFAI